MKSVRLFFENLKIREKLLLSFSFTGLIILLTGISVYNAYKKLESNNQDLILGFHLNSDIIHLKYLISKDQLLYMELMSTQDREEFYISWQEHKNKSAEISKVLNKILVNLNNDVWGERFYELKKDIVDNINLIENYNNKMLAPSFEEAYNLKRTLIENLKLADQSLVNNTLD